MDIALIVIGIFIVVVIAMWAGAHMGDPKKIDREEEDAVRSESTQEHERATFDEVAQETKQHTADTNFYGHDTDSGSTYSE
ncbi:MAG TPA: hypothetical protein VGP13_00400 [Candidatus Paceibacterota bacterium]|jgi:hypothetical protein|nr:hypothetical protein [Candidatus Paceibacterota bacterium]